MVDVLILLGSGSDMPIAAKAKEALDPLGISNEIKVASAHRTPDLLDKLIKESSAKVFIGIAGLSAALPGVIASKTAKPVIGVPVNVKLDGLDALLSTMQLPPGVPVATVGIDNGKNAALLAARILALSDKKLAEKLGKK
ncbi:TPA: 5-(carboxyamino)imidazole ribonucleotide mutase [Candidatus Micrarchaeota archaeon]|nr:5-(carboxyamino)imidazole ribonucleotide mutase [Candidatus Micrarchaeota archaeon]